ncbi:RasGEF domain-containing protein [Legionella fallonii]|uniref:Putative Dot/Icm T4SS effector [RasGEF domain] n=1 Tax=Legionella fallonii LLAP-10 TaxID=1212491 RepID=A0A098G820_9GAMM|nr:RasGEF domain-containing protein [Legionella fallonii]CEG58613.1 putative Dot/Icm T4SS effector [RasGEF domain] [Legionella fallonii LLAP-10]
MPEVLKSLAYQKIEHEINHFFDLIHDKYKKYGHKKKGTKDIISSQISQFLDELSNSILAQSRLVFTNIPSKEIINFKSVDSRKPGDSFQNIDEAAKYFNNLSSLIYFSVMQHENPTQRVFFYDMYIQLMNFCYLKGDLLGAGAIYTGLISNNLSNVIDRKQLSRESRLIWEEREVSFNRLFNVGTSYNEQNNLRKKFKTITPVLPLLLSIQTQSKEHYDGFVNSYNEIQDRLHALDRQNNIMLNGMQSNEYFSWSKPYYDYMKNVYLPQSIAEYTTLFKEYRELISEHGGPIAKQFHDDATSKPLVTFVEVTLSENKTIVESSPLPNTSIAEMLEEIDDIKRAYTKPALFDDISWNLMKINSAKVKAKPIGDSTSMIFNKIETPEIEERIDENQQDTVVSKDLPLEEQYRFHHTGAKLMLELAGAIERHKPKNTDINPIVGRSCSFFSSKNMKKQKEGYSYDTVGVDEHDSDKEFIQVEPNMVF